jgi:hypothetical protein
LEEFSEGYLKKQSQFAGSQTGVNSCVKGKYDEFDALRRRKNKANSKPIASLRPEIYALGILNSQL